MNLNNLSGIKSQANALWQIGFDFWKEPIMLYKTPLEIQVSSGPNYNFFYENGSNDLTTNFVTQSGIFYGIVEFIDQEDNNQRKYRPTDTPAIVSEAKLRLTFEMEALPYFDNLEKIIVDGRNFRKLSDSQPRGIFDRNQFNIWCVPIE